MKKLTAEACVLKCLSDFQPWAFWELQQEIHNGTGQFFGEPTISAAIRRLRRLDSRKKYDLPLTKEIIEREKIFNSTGFKYRLNTNVMNHWSKNDER